MPEQLSLDNALKELEESKKPKRRSQEGWDKSGQVYWVDGLPFGIKLVPTGLANEFIAMNGIVQEEK